jgi:glycerophosphoryl diester phosphodiesterase
LQVIGHRGWPARYADNSLEGIVAASEVAAMVETDVRRANGALVISHDPVTEPTDPLHLDRLLEALPDYPLNLEVKNFPGEAGFEPHHEIGVDTAARARRQDLLTCFFWPTVDEIHRAYPSLATGILVDQGWDLALALKHAVRCGHTFLMPHWSVALEQRQSTELAAEHGLRIVVWTLNDPQRAPELANLGVSGIITDDPGAMSAALKELL